MENAKRAPAFQLYPQDFISSVDVQMMSAAEVGAYCLLLFNSWTQNRQGFLPTDEAQLRHISRLDAEQWKKSKKRLLAKFPATPDKKLRYNPRLVLEADKQATFREKQAENGKRGGRPRLPENVANPPLSPKETQNNPSLSQALEVAKPKKALPSSSSTSSSVSETSKQASKAEDFEFLADECPLFLTKNFSAFLDSIGYPEVDKVMYLLRIQAKAQEDKPRTEKLWKRYIQRWLDNDKASRNLLLKDGGTLRNPSKPTPSKHIPQR